ncbi:MAG TPA: VOC family protein [Candidatus Acidoferrum sp.]|nr:VOC family protein [Candidatus Acidoferrum sp.]
MKISHLVLWVQDNTLSAKFYKKLGFSITHSDDQTSTVRLDGFEIVLVTMRDDEEFVRDSLAGSKGRGMYVYVAVEDVDKQYDKLVTVGIRPRTKPRDWPWGNREFIVKDPDGYKLCFWHATR